ncbi:hypothetical protein EV356DRAFT_390448 [Viridothelium virens]|uniref:Uncharacterized protein n=1 Tax=Viridothelium virens TaxID=1048519 RepID=A0A6A6GU97_VIRVR|nr:hypothetical protein EV356DRAFT_390448 [Viridothelium virens]
MSKNLSKFAIFAAIASLTTFAAPVGTHEEILDHFGGTGLHPPRKIIPHKEIDCSSVAKLSDCDDEHALRVRLWKQCQKYASAEINLPYDIQAQADTDFKKAFVIQNEDSRLEDQMTLVKRADGGDSAKPSLLSAAVQFAKWLNADKDKPAEDCFLNSCKEKKDAGKKDKQEEGPGKSPNKI